MQNNTFPQLFFEMLRQNYSTLLPISLRPCRPAVFPFSRFPVSSPVFAVTSRHSLSAAVANNYIIYYYYYNI